MLCCNPAHGHRLAHHLVLCRLVLPALGREPRISVVDGIHDGNTRSPQSLEEPESNEMRRQHVRPGRFDPLADFVGTTPGNMYGHTGFDEPIRHAPAPPRAEDRGVHSRGGKGEREQRHDLLQPPLVELLDHEPAANRLDPESAEGQAGGKARPPRYTSQRALRQRPRHVLRDRVPLVDPIADIFDRTLEDNVLGTQL